MANVFPYWTKLMFVKPILVMTNSKSNKYTHTKRILDQFFVLVREYR